MPEGLPTNTPILWMWRLSQPVARPRLCSPRVPGLAPPKHPSAWRTGETGSRDTFLAQPYLIADHVCGHLHATAGVGAAQDELISAVLRLAAGVPEGQAGDGALESLGQGGWHCQEAQAPWGLPLTPSTKLCSWLAVPQPRPSAPLLCEPSSSCTV